MVTNLIKKACYVLKGMAFFHHVHEFGNGGNGLRREVVKAIEDVLPDIHVNCDEELTCPVCSLSVRTSSCLLPKKNLRNMQVANFSRSPPHTKAEVWYDCYWTTKTIPIIKQRFTSRGKTGCVCMVHISTGFAEFLTQPYSMC